MDNVLVWPSPPRSEPVKRLFHDRNDVTVLAQVSTSHASEPCNAEYKYRCDRLGACSCNLVCGIILVVVERGAIFRLCSHHNRQGSYRARCQLADSCWLLGSICIFFRDLLLELLRLFIRLCQDYHQSRRCSREPVSEPRCELDTMLVADSAEFTPYFALASRQEEWDEVLVCGTVEDPGKTSTIHLAVSTDEEGEEFVWLAIRAGPGELRKPRAKTARTIRTAPFGLPGGEEAINWLTDVESDSLWKPTEAILEDLVIQVHALRCRLVVHGTPPSSIAVAGSDVEAFLTLCGLEALPATGSALKTAIPLADAGEVPTRRR